MPVIDEANLANVCAKDATRYAMNGIQVTPSGTWSTDGKCAMFVPAPGHDTEECPSGLAQPDQGDQEFQIAAVGVKSMKSVFKRPAQWKGHVQGAIMLEAKKDEIAVHGLIKDGKHETHVKRQIGAFPNMQAVVPKDLDDARAGFFNVPLMKKLLTAMEQAWRARGKDPSTMHARFQFPAKKNGACRVDCKDGFFGVLMPVTTRAGQPDPAFDGPWPTPMPGATEKGWEKRGAIAKGEPKAKAGGFFARALERNS